MRLNLLSDPNETPLPIATHLSHDPFRTVFSAISKTLAATPPLLPVEMADRSPKTGLGGGVSQKKPASEAYHAVGGIDEIVPRVALQKDSEGLRGIFLKETRSVPKNVIRSGPGKPNQRKASS